MSRRPVLWLIVTQFTGVLRLNAQTRDSAFVYHRASQGVVTAAAGATLTAPLRVTNNRMRPVTFKPAIETPKGWSVILGNADFSVPSNATDTWLISVSVPARASAGSYIIRLNAFSEDSRKITDSVVVEIRERHLLEVRLASRPDYAIAGSAYAASFLVRNKGNAPAPVAIRLKSTLAKKISAKPAAFILAPGEVRTIQVGVQTRKVNLRAGEDVLEVSALHGLDTAANAHVSSNITIVQSAGYVEPRITIPSVLRLRGSPKETASPFEFSGGGSLRSSGEERISFVARGPSGKSSAFGERDEYWVSLENARYAVHAGDNLYKLSPLLGGGQPGFGGSVKVNVRDFSVGGFTQRFRYQEGRLAERGAALGWKGSDRFNLSLNAIDRPNGIFRGRVAGVSGFARPVSDMNMEFDMSRNLKAGGSASARSLHVNGRAPFQYDFGHVAGDSLFLGPARGITHSYGVISGSPFGQLRASLSGSEHRVTSQQSDFPGRSEKYRSLGTGFAWNGWLSLDLAQTRQEEGTMLQPVNASERSATLRSSRNFSFGNFWLSAERGHADRGVERMTSYGMYSGGATVNAGVNSFSLFSDVYTGGSITRGEIPFVNAGGEVGVQLSPLTRVSVIGFSSRTRDGSPGGYSQIDTRISKSFSGGSSISFRTRRTTVASSGPAKLVGYFEYALPIGVPAFRSSVTGHAIGRVVDSETGRGLPNTLVRLGPQAAITDRDGRVHFSALPAGQYRASLAQEKTTSDRIFIGNPDITIDSLNAEPAMFNLAVERPATVRGALREWMLVKTGIGNQQDSLKEGPAIEGMTVALIGAKDTLYRLTDDAGQFMFREVPRGEWILKVVSDAPAGKRFDPIEVMLPLKAGELLVLPLRLIPQRRTIRMIGGDAQPVEQAPAQPVKRQ